MREVEIVNWEALKAEIARTDSSGRKRIYRGVTNFDKHKLTPKIGREDARKDPANGNPLPHSEEDEKRFLDLFRRDVRQFFDSEHTDIELLAIAQHHGASTRLLDWTRNPLIAAFFATEKAGTAGRPAIYVLDFPEPLGAEDPFSITDVRSYEPPPYLPSRISAQSSVLTVQPRPSEKYHSPSLEVWQFPQGRPSFLLKVQINNECGLNRASLFPDLGGVAEYAGWLYKWGFPKDLRY